MSEQTSEVNSQNVCGLCNEKSSKYCCPRCNVLYCSLDCYKSEKHLTCSESFYKDCVNEELASHQADDESKRKMIEILKRMQNEDLGNPDDIEEMLQNLDENGKDDEPIDSDDEQEIDLHDRIKDLNLDDPDALWNALTTDERNEFEALLNQGDVGSIIPQWQPWWMYHKEEKLVENVDEKDKPTEDRMADCPSLVKVPKFTDLTVSIT
ncbi:zinc finger HIT domain-containing protein 2-like [Ostrinia furnacalis]|uniref:zinc finger HIT domain-containing protein 2-like n=1 Tax=Ostrinia furnacalis TaxID=93504 RepID=UPI00103A3C3D|nr:zinc finger HIT domain-containing protein 2-like [Ostrinia furnacalis]